VKRRDGVEKVERSAQELWVRAGMAKNACRGIGRALFSGKWVSRQAGGEDRREGRGAQELARGDGI